jgi:hypothetical protein
VIREIDFQVCQSNMKQERMHRYLHSACFELELKRVTVARDSDPEIHILPVLLTVPIRNSATQTCVLKHRQDASPLSQSRRCKSDRQTSAMSNQLPASCSGEVASMEGPKIARGDTARR